MKATFAPLGTWSLTVQLPLRPDDLGHREIEVLSLTSTSRRFIRNRLYLARSEP